MLPSSIARGSKELKLCWKGDDWMDAKLHFVAVGLTNIVCAGAHVVEGKFHRSRIR